ncbi:hypothetical protein [Streptodolium elevatio]
MPEHPRSDEGDSTFERGLPGALRAASDDFPAPSADLVGRGHRRGRGLRRTRNLRIGVAATVLTAAVLGGTYAVVGTVGDGGEPTSLAAPVPSAPALASDPASAEVPPVDGATMLANLKSLLPPGGSFSEENSRGTAREPGAPYGGGSAGLIYRNADGTSGVGVSVARGGGGGVCPPIQVAPHSECASETLPDGSTLVGSKSFTYPSKNTGQKYWYAVMTYPNGVSVSVGVYGGGGEKATTSPVAPILSIDQIKAAAKSGTWAAAVASVASQTPVPQAPPAGASGDDILALLRTFAPQGAAVTNEFGQTGHASMLVDDGKGKSAVGINVQRNMTQALAGLFSCGGLGEGSISCTQRTLGDGSELLLIKRPSEKGGSAQVWTADLLRPDGRRVVVSAIDSVSEAASPTRSAPALSLPQLEAVVTDARWLDLV